MSGKTIEREVILIGLGEFGARTVGLFNGLFAERKHQLKDSAKVSVYDLVFDTKSSSFVFADLTRAIVERVKGAEGRKFAGKFSYIFAGDLFDEGTAKYAVHYAYLPWIIEQTGTIRKDDILGFFTFSDELGASVSCSSESMANILGFFKSLDEIDRQNVYYPPYNDANEQPFAPIDSPNGPFSRNYVVVTPGGQKAVMEETSQVFAERIFYELFELSETYKNLESSLQARRSESNGSCFCTFSMVQISRLADLQRYFLKYTLENRAADFMLADKIGGTDIEYFEKQFFAMLDIGESDEFPIERAANLFIEKNRASLERVLNPYIKKSASDFSDYVAECKSRIDERVLELSAKIEDFVRSEMANFRAVLDSGLKHLFLLDRFTGNISSYIAFAELLRSRFQKWEESLSRLAQTQADISLDSEFSKVKTRVEKLQSSFLYRLPPFVPLRRILLEDAILDLPVEEFFKAKIRIGIAKAADSWWHISVRESNGLKEEINSPVLRCENLIADLARMKCELQEKKKQIQQKMCFLVNIPSFYYIISQIDSARYSALLNRIESRNFSNLSEIEEAARNVFKAWTENRDLDGISKDSEGFVEFACEEIAQKAAEGFGKIEENADDFAQFAQFSVEKMRARSEQLTQKSFRTQNQSEFLSEKRILLNPQMERLDSLGERLLDFANIDSLEVPNEFTLGSAVFFEDFLYMNMNALQKIDILKRYAGEKTSEQKFDSAKKSGGVLSDELDFAEKITRSILLDFCSEEQRLSLYAGEFALAEKSLDDGQINALSKSLPLKNALLLLGAEDLSGIAKEIGAALSPEKERQINLILKTAEKF